MRALLPDEPKSIDTGVGDAPVGAGARAEAGREEAQDVRTNEIYRAMRERDGDEALATDALAGRYKLTEALHTVCTELAYGGSTGEETKERLARMIAEERIRMEVLVSALGIKDMISESRAGFLQRMAEEVNRGEVPGG